jgi:hypothetical protein
MSTGSNKFKVINIDSLVRKHPELCVNVKVLDLAVASSVAYRTVDFEGKRLKHLTECATHSVSLWAKLVQAADQRYWIPDKHLGIAVFNATDHCGTPRTYRLNGSGYLYELKPGTGWIELPDEDAFYLRLDTPAARQKFEAWRTKADATTRLAIDFAEGRLRNTAVDSALIIASPTGCVVCGEEAPAYAATTMGMGAEGASFIQVQLCPSHLDEAKTHPSVFSFLETIFKLDSTFNAVVKQESIPDELIEPLQMYVAEQLQGTTRSAAEKRDNGWFFEVYLSTGWRWQFRLRTLTDYGYMLQKPGEKKAMYRADSAPDHPELLYPPHHQHSRPDRKSDVRTPSFMYGIPLFDLRGLLAKSIELGALEPTGSEATGDDDRT